MDDDGVNYFTHLLRDGYDVASVRANRRQLLVRRRRRVAEPHRSVQSFRAAVHDELELHSAAVNPTFDRTVTDRPAIRPPQVFFPTV